MARQVSLRCQRRLGKREEIHFQKLEEKFEKLSSNQDTQIVLDYYLIDSRKCLNKAFISSDTLEVDFSRTLEMQEKILFGGEKTESCCLEKSVCHFFHRWLADRVKSIEDLDLQGQGYKVPEVYWEKSVNIDVVEENVWNLKPEDLFGLSETREIAEVPENDGK